MCLFRKKPKVKIDSKFSDGDYVRFKHRGELTFGWVYNIYTDKEGKVIYDIQIGGQCPAILYGLKEEELTLIESEK